MKQIIINAYEYHELEPSAQAEVVYWLDKNPCECQNDQGEMEFSYFSDMTDEEIQEHCEWNGYLFDDKGRPVHHLGETIATRDDDRWAIDWEEYGIDPHPNDKLIKKVLEYICYTSDIESVYCLMYHIPREALLELVDEEEDDEDNS